MKTLGIAAAVLVFVVGVIPSPLASPGKSAAAPADPSPAVKKESPLACNLSALTPKERKRHFDELGPKLRALKKGVRELADGYEFEFPSDPATYLLLSEWAAGERTCCPFFDVDLRSTREGGSVFLSLTGRENVKRFIEVDGAAWLEE